MRESLADVDMICKHVECCGCSQDQSETTGMWNWAKSVVEIAGV